jgi:hypothetical protein
LVADLPAVLGAYLGSCDLRGVPPAHLVCYAAAWRYMRVARMRGETIYRVLGAKNKIIGHAAR